MAIVKLLSVEVPIVTTAHDFVYVKNTFFDGKVMKNMQYETIFCNTILLAFEYVR